MFLLIMMKELKSIIQSPKFLGTLAVCSLLILTSIFVGIREYENAVLQYETNKQIVRQDAVSATGWNSVRNIVHRAPTPMQIFVSGVHFDVGRLSRISSRDDVKLTRSPYSDEPVFALFRIIDFSFIVQVILSLFAILFTYNAINGEREDGTLKLAFSNSVSRIQYLMGKFAGIWVGLVVPLIIPILIGLLLILLVGIPLENSHWVSISVFLGLSLAYITFFIVLGLFFSSITRNSAQSFLYLLVFWISSVMIIPRAGVIAAGQVKPVESIAQMEAQQQAFQKARWDQYSSEIGDMWQSREEAMVGMSEEERQEYRDEKEWEWIEESDELRKGVQTDILENNRKLIEENLNKKRAQEDLAFKLARISPSSSYRLASMNLTGTDVNLKNRYEEQMRLYRDDFASFVEQKQAESGNRGGFSISISSTEGVSIDAGRQDPIDTSEIPQFESPQVEFASVFSASVMDMMLILIFTVVVFGGTFISFIRYDMR